jgi:hypothetical protein
MMDLFPVPLLHPQLERVIGGPPMARVMGHHPPCSARADDVKNRLGYDLEGALGDFLDVQ